MQVLGGLVSQVNAVRLASEIVALVSVLSTLSVRPEPAVAAAEMTTVVLLVTLLMVVLAGIVAAVMYMPTSAAVKPAEAEVTVVPAMVTPSVTEWIGAVVLLKRVLTCAVTFHPRNEAVASLISR